MLTHSMKTHLNFLLPLPNHTLDSCQPRGFDPRLLILRLLGRQYL